jgi:hypothetical protein
LASSFGKHCCFARQTDRQRAPKDPTWTTALVLARIL